MTKTKTKTNKTNKQVYVRKDEVKELGTNRAVAKALGRNLKKYVYSLNNSTVSVDGSGNSTQTYRFDSQRAQNGGKLTLVRQ